jgi:LysR family transcriptional regulator, cyn operon transcriptional activator
VLLESGAPPTLLALAQAGYGIAIVPSNSRIPRGGVRAVPVVRQGEPISRWLSVAWDPRRFLALYGEQFVDELIRYSRRRFPRPRVPRRLPPLPKPREQTNETAG